MTPPPSKSTLFPYTTLFRSLVISLGEQHSFPLDSVFAMVRPAKLREDLVQAALADRKSTRLNSSHLGISYAVFCLKKKKRYTRRRSSAHKASSNVWPGDAKS